MLGSRRAPRKRCGPAERILPVPMDEKGADAPNAATGRERDRGPATERTRTRRDPTPSTGHRTRPSAPPTERLSLGSRVAARVGLSAVAWGGLAGLGMSLVLAAFGYRDPVILSMVVAASIASGIAAFVAARRVFARRLTRVASFVEQRIQERSSPGTVEAADELDRVEVAIDRLLRTLDGKNRDAAVTSQREAILVQDLATKTDELARRLEERNVLFDVLRESAASQNLESVLDTLAQRLGPVLRFREVAVLIKRPDGELAVRAAWGFADATKVLGRTVRPGEGLTGDAVASGKPVVVTDVASSPDYLAFWGEVARTGTFIAVPIRAGGETIGMLALTRPPTDPLKAAESRYLAAVADQVALAIKNAQLFLKLEELSTKDELTGLPNRRYLNERLERDIAEAKRWQHPLSVLVIDIDHFKKLNDREGHAAGDEALVAVARAIERVLRAVDVVTRWGGEEFVVILGRTGLDDAQIVAEKVRVAVSEIEVSSAKGQPFGHLSVSVGVAELTGGEAASSLVQRADRAVYVSKRAGRNRVSLPPPSSPPPPLVPAVAAPSTPAAEPTPERASSPP